MRLGVDVMEAGHDCPKCGARMDGQGILCMSCMTGGDATAIREGIKDTFRDFCTRAVLNPISEALQILWDDGRRVTAER